MASVTVFDPSDTIGKDAFASDNALLSNYSVPYISVQGIPNVAPTTVTNATQSLLHSYYEVSDNDTSVIVITEGSDVLMNDDTVVKYGYSSNLLEASFYGVNAAVWVGNGSIATIENSNITVHNGAANVFSYGTGSVVHADHLFLYASGPVSHGLYASGNGTIVANNVAQYSGGYRSSAFSGDSPAGYVHVSNSVAHTDGYGSAICYALGLCNVTNVVGHASKSPAMFMDGYQEAFWTDCDITAGKLAGMVIFSSAERQSGARVSLDHTRLTVLEAGMASLWFGNVVATASINSSVLNNTASGIFVIANVSQINQDFNHFVGYEENPDIAPADVELSVSNSHVTGDARAYNGSSLALEFLDYSIWTGAVVLPNGPAPVSVNLDATSHWTLTGDSKVENFTTATGNVSNVESAGFSIYYDPSSTANAWLCNETQLLKGGGWLKPST